METGSAHQEPSNAPREYPPAQPQQVDPRRAGHAVPRSSRSSKPVGRGVERAWPRMALAGNGTPAGDCEEDELLHDARGRLSPVPRREHLPVFAPQPLPAAGAHAVLPCSSAPPPGTPRSGCARAPQAFRSFAGTSRTQRARCHVLVPGHAASRGTLDRAPSRLRLAGRRSRTVPPRGVLSVAWRCGSGRGFVRQPPCGRSAPSRRQARPRAAAARGSASHRRRRPW